MTTSKKISSLVTDDGEIVQLREIRKPKQSYGQRFTIVFDDALYSIAQKMTNGATARVFLALPALLDFTGWNFIDQSELAKDLKIDRGTVNRALAELLRLNIIAKKGNPPRTMWQFTTTTTWRGNVSSYHVQRQAEERQTTRPSVNPCPPPIVAERISPKVENQSLRLLRTIPNKGQRIAKTP